MSLLPNEEQLVVSNAGKITLTNFRIFMQQPEASGSYVISIFLEKISSIESRYSSNPLLGLFGLIAIILGILLYFDNIFTGGNIPMILIIGGVLLFVMYYATRKHMIKIASDGGASLDFEANNISSEEIEKFLYEVQLAKLKRVSFLSQTNLT